MNVNIYSWNTGHFQAIIFAYGTSVNFQHKSWRLTVQCLTSFLYDWFAGNKFNLNVDITEIM